ncbi:hypothetical protein D3C77_258870 [compost metagenome]
MGGALVARQQVGPVVRGQEGGQRLHSTHDPHQIVVAQSEDGRHEVVTLALVAQKDGQAVGEEAYEVSLNCVANPEGL